MFNLDINMILLTLPGILIGLTLHEFSHAYVACLLGDPTAKEHGRLTLNPIYHIDLLGFLMLIFFKFGWAKPVPINPNNFTKKKKGYFLVSIAGPLSNILLSIILTIILGIVIKLGVNIAIYEILYFAIFINLVLAVFNLLPIPPLDGSKILLAILPNKFEYKYYQIERYTHIILFALIYFKVTNKILFPVVYYILNILTKLLNFII